MLQSTQLKRVEKTLKTKFGLRKLRAGQSDVIESVLAKQNTLAIMPTGAGKSLCYQLPSMHMRGATVVVSPLISLMKDQKEKLDELGIEAVQMNSALQKGEERETLRDVKDGATEFIYTTPEQLTHPDFIKVLKKTDIALFVIDEAHCVSQWGHDFRPAFLNLRQAIKDLGSPPVLALTATATNEVIEDIQKQLGLKQMNVFNSGVLRENLIYEVVRLEKEKDKLPALIKLLGDAQGSTIVYAATVKNVEMLEQELRNAGHQVVKYHGRMSIAARNESQEAFMRGRTPLIVATNAFGLGIDKPDIRTVIHFQFPGSLENYYQESGRAGRDGKASRCVLLYLRKDKCTQSFFLAGKYPSAEDIDQVYKAVSTLGPATAKDRKQLEEKVQDIVGKAVAKTKTKVILAAMSEAKMFKASPKKGLSVSTDRLAAADLKSIVDQYAAKKDNDQDKINKMIVYAQTALCRWKTLLSYFDEEAEWKDCGHCDNCRHPITSIQ